MDNKHIPPLEPENPMSESLTDLPKEMEPLEDRPVIEELTFDSVLPETQTIPEEPEALDLPVEEEPIPEETMVHQPTEVQESITLQKEPELPAAEPSDAVFDEPLISVADTAGEHERLSEEIPEPEVNSEEPADLPDISPFLPVEETEDQEYQEDSNDFEAMMRAAASQPETAKTTEPAVAPKGRPKRKKGEGLLGIPSILATFVWLALIVIIGVTAGRMLWICAADVLAFGREDKVVTVTVYEADTMEDIIDKLHEGGLIRYKSLFSLYANISDAEEDIKPGIYDLNTRYDYHALVNFMSPRSSREVIKLTIPEGYTCRQIFALLEENRICTAVDAAAYAAKGELSEYWFLEDVDRGTENCLEGYLFPDTYEFYKNSTPKEAIERMLDNFDYRFNEEMIEQIDAINSKFRADYGVREIVIIASLIEKESAAPGESPMVSGVIYNRLFKWGNNPPYLNIDASIVYAQEGNNARIDTSLESPYNTYLYEGLTPGPIANPGLSSLKAALNPESHNYYYYVLNPGTGMHQFSTTYEEHQGYVREFNAAPEIEIE